MKFLVDENLPTEATELLRAAGHDAASVTDLHLGGSTDAVVAELARKAQQALITLDVDFANTQVYPPADYFGLIVLRLSAYGRRHVLAVIQQIVPHLKDETLLVGKLWIVEEGRVRMIDFTRRMQEVYARLERVGLVSVAEIGGAALGGGFELALACDLRLVADTAKIGLPEVRLGLLPAAGGTQRMTRLCGKGVASRLILGAEIVTGAEAVALGLAHWVAPPDELQATARAVVERIAQLPRAALAASKACIGAALDGSSNGFEVELAGSRMLLGQQETQQRVRRFLEKQT